jgi:site-specific DNA-methyltransferase (adenine-specific)
MEKLSDFHHLVVGDAVVYHGSNLDVLPFMADNSVDSIVTDPPYELGFMGKKWDSTGIAYSVELWRECLRVLKPGGHLLAFGGSRTWHRLAVAIEDAGFDIRDSVAWLYGSGFPKSHNISLSIDKHFGYANRGKAIPVASTYQASDIEEKNKLTSNPVDEYSAKTDEGQKWAGWGTALKPAFEPIVVARKPLIGTVAENVLTWGVGGLNIDASRIGTEERVNQPAGSLGNGQTLSGGQAQTDRDAITVQGRWPANIILDEYTAGLLDEQSGHLHGDGNKKDTGMGTDRIYQASSYQVSYQGRATRSHGDSGGASRFFYVSKASKRDRNEGLDELPQKQTVGGGGGVGDYLEDVNSASGKYGSEKAPAKNFHPTVKPTDLMRYLVKLVTPAGGTVLDPFTGSGSTGKAALLDGYKFIGIELTEDYLPIIEGRLIWSKNQVENLVRQQQQKEQETLF